MGECLGVLALLVLTTSLRLAAQQTAPEFELSRGKAGRIEVGMSVDDVYQVVGRERTRLIDRYREGMFDPALEIRLQGGTAQPAIIVPVGFGPCSAWSVQGIEVRDARFRTARGIGVGSTLAEVSKAYDVTLSEEEGPHAWAASVRMNFRFDNVSVPTARVRSVWLPGDVVAVPQARCP